MSHCNAEKIWQFVVQVDYICFVGNNEEKLMFGDEDKV